MSLPEAYRNEIQVLDQLIFQTHSSDIIQLCADYFNARLAADRAASYPSYRDRVSNQLSAAYTSNSTRMSGPFSSPFGANANPFGGDRPQKGMHSVVEEDENDTAAPGAAPAFTGFFGGDATSDGPPMMKGPPNTDSYPAQYNFGRRTSVSAESLKPSADTYDNWTPPFHEKSAEQLDRLKRSIEGNFLFSHLDEEQSAQILGALVEKPIPAKDIKVQDDA